MTIILKKEGVEIMGIHKMPYPGEQDQGLTDQVIQATKKAQRDALAIEDDAIAQLEAADRFEYTVDELVDRVEMLMADVDCVEDLLEKYTGVPLTKNLRGAVEAFRDRQLAELRRLKAGRVVV